MQRYGADRIICNMIVENWYRDYMPKYKDSLDSGDYTMPHSEELIDDHRCIQLVKGIPKIPEGLKNTDKDGGKRHGDGAIAACLLWQAVLECAVEFSFMTTGSRNYGAHGSSGAGHTSFIGRQVNPSDLKGFTRHG